MPVTTDLPATTRHDSVSQRQRFTRADCDALRDSGVLTGHYELINGEIINKMGQNPPHFHALLRIRNWLVSVFGIERMLSQMPINVSDDDSLTNEPEPDVAITGKPATEYAGRLPGTRDIIMAVEVSDTSLSLDRTTKALLYARAGFPEYWIVDIAGRQLIVHRAPISGVYTDVVIHTAEEEAATLARTEARIRVGDLFVTG